MPEDLESPALFELLALLALAFTEPSPHFGPQPTMIATSIATVTTAAIITRVSRFLFKSASSGCVGYAGLVDSAAVADATPATPASPFVAAAQSVPLVLLLPLAVPSVPSLPSVAVDSSAFCRACLNCLACLSYSAFAALALLMVEEASAAQLSVFGAVTSVW